MTTLYNYENVLAEAPAKEVFTVFDFETTGLDYNTEQVVEVAAIRTDLKQELGRLHMYVKLHEGKKLPDFLIDNTDLREHMLTNGVHELQMMIVLNAFIGNSTLVAHYLPFDSAYLSKFGINHEHFLCTRSIERFLNPNESASLGPTAKRRGVKLEGAHRAMNDIEATIGVLKSQLQEIEERKIPRSHISNIIIDSEERPNKFSPKYAKVKTPKEIDLVGKRVKVRDKNNRFHNEKGTIIEAYLQNVVKENKGMKIEGNEGERILVIQLDEGIGQVVLNDKFVKYNGGYKA
ncbi:3'-5' exonuclease [Bacillus cereus]|uniref:3'-5' exonuclease n=1 Tax=Bacillus cereus TaxID=1396 RepID=UPI000BEBF4F4|nr:3'-5' exonuclease [Bacillus cereus]MDA2236531.1 3'-5' exonuclease [Bacillus cereus]PEF92012.1 DNA polymerase III subunit epsilon [Bacillus cereus]